ncbi:ABC transporter permease [Paenibacillus koleovorans]|uniref:ABC transporter permease n=1 Tax=Paenibacillus koleovorans TaxID=121608 RepID=UPI000FD8DA78|nr:ABC-2 family transporter protein [Paenibacillus koleovorans]
MSYFPLYWAFVRIKLKSMTEYRSSFLLVTVSKTIMIGAELALVWLLVYRFQTIAGWSTYEIMLLFGLNMASYALAGFFFYHPFVYLPRRIQTGEFDEILTKPLNPFLYLLSREFSTGYFSNLTVAFVAVTIAFVKLGVSLGPLDLLFLVLVLIGGALIQASAFVYTAVPAFWVIQSGNLSRLMFDFKGFVRYPLTAYNGVIQVLLTLIIPFAFINFYPAQYFLGKDDFLMFHPFFQYLTPLVGLAMFALAYWFWTVGIRHYRSTGS